MTEVSSLDWGIQSKYGLTQSDVVIAKKKKFSVWVESMESEVPMGPRGCVFLAKIFWGC